MTRESASPVWPTSPPPAVSGGRTWPLGDVGELPRVRARLRHHLLDALGPGGAPGEVSGRVSGRDAELLDRVVLAFDEMASNALRHGGPGVTATITPYQDSWLIEVRDGAAVRPPTPAVGRDPGQGGLGLYLIAEMSTAHGWHTEAASKVVWALLPR